MEMEKRRNVPINQLNLMGKMASKIIDMLAGSPSYIKSYEDMKTVLDMVGNMIEAGKEET
ncbi:hypothetical protein [Bacilliculturomica massiliensis]|uniref:hypothetical protein n=1 Tax=Bacilliculturomica massiliensis TaxID=1917867 RepID=UPI0010310426|nr:hypothetical protein [Bacilliculturomica massiliensis]